MRQFQLTQNIFCSRFAPAEIALWLILSRLIMLTLIGCATSVTSTSFDPASINEVSFRDRSQSEYDDEVRVTVAVPTADENKALFSANLHLREIQSTLWSSGNFRTSLPPSHAGAGCRPKKPIPQLYGKR